jgi:hypothetical protein
MVHANIYVIKRVVFLLFSQYEVETSGEHEMVETRTGIGSLLCDG